MVPDSSTICYIWGPHSGVAGIWRYVVGYSRRSEGTAVLGILDPEAEGSARLRNVGKYEASQCHIPKTSDRSVSCFVLSHSHTLLVNRNTRHIGTSAGPSWCFIHSSRTPVYCQMCLNVSVDICAKWIRISAIGVRTKECHLEVDVAHVNVPEHETDAAGRQSNFKRAVCRSIESLRARWHLTALIRPAHDRWPLCVGIVAIAIFI